MYFSESSFYRYSAITSALAMQPAGAMAPQQQSQAPTASTQVPEASVTRSSQETPQNRKSPSYSRSETEPPKKKGDLAVSARLALAASNRATKEERESLLAPVHAADYIIDEKYNATRVDKPEEK